MTDDDVAMQVPQWARQSQAEVRFEWGPLGVEAVRSPHVVIVDVLRFTTAVDAAVSRGASVFPYRWRDDSAVAFAEQVGATLAGSGDASGPSLSPVAMGQLHAWRDSCPRSVTRESEYLRQMESDGIDLLARSSEGGWVPTVRYVRWNAPSLTRSSIIPGCAKRSGSWVTVTIVAPASWR